MFGYTTTRPVIADPQDKLDLKNIKNATITLTNADAKQFQPGDQCTYFDLSGNALRSEGLTISTIAKPDSGG